MPKEQPETRIRSCHVCGTKYEYPIKNNRATRFHCNSCVEIPLKTRKILEKLTARIRKLEKQLDQQNKS